MEFNKTYIIKDNSILVVLNKLQEFQTTFEKFITKYNKSNYRYVINIEKDSEEEWICKIKLNDKSDITGRAQKITRAS